MSFLCVTFYPGTNRPPKNYHQGQTLLWGPINCPKIDEWTLGISCKCTPSVPFAVICFVFNLLALDLK